MSEMCGMWQTKLYNNIYMRMYCKLAQHVQFSNYNIWLKLVGDGAVLF